MLIHPWDRGESEQQWLDFVREQGFGQLIAAGRDRDVAVVAPTQFVAVSTELVVLHLARPNPVWAALAENPAAILSVAGDWSYIPGAWRAKAGLDDALGVPTTYYAAVQLIVEASVVDDPAGKAEILRTQLAVTEPDGGGLVDPAEHPRELPGLRGLRLAVREVRAKFKYDGQKDAAHRARVAARLADRDGPGDRAALRRLSSAP